MTSPRRVGNEASRTRSLILDVTEKLLVEDSFAAVTSRRVAAAAGVNPALIHYYFPALDDLFVAVYRRRAEGLIADLAAAMDTDQPLWAIWEWNSDVTGVAFAAEFLAMANHRKAIRTEIAETAERLRRRQIEALTGVFDRYRIATEMPDPAAVVVLMVAVPRLIVIEDALGMTTGHAQARHLIEQYLTRLEGPRQ